MANLIEKIKDKRAPEPETPERRDVPIVHPDPQQGLTGAQVRERLYATGWAKRGPVGLIGSTKSDALLIVTNMLEDLSKAAEGGRVAADRDPESIDRLLASRGVKPIDFAGWKKVDAFERAEGAKEGREHKKIIDPEQMRALAHA